MKEKNTDCDCGNTGDINNILMDSINEETIFDIADFFKVLGDSTRIKLLLALFSNEMCVSDLSEALDMTQSAISHQLRVLRLNDLVKFRKEGKTVYYSLDDEHISIMLEQGLSHILHKNIYEH